VKWLAREGEWTGNPLTYGMHGGWRVRTEDEPVTRLDRLFRAHDAYLYEARIDGKRAGKIVDDLFLVRNIPAQWAKAPSLWGFVYGASAMVLMLIFTITLFRLWEPETK